VQRKMPAHNMWADVRTVTCELKGHTLGASAVFVQKCFWQIGTIPAFSPIV
jgi:hypothetical protein